MLLTKNDWLNIVKGATILSTGGGGDLQEAKEVFKEVFKNKKQIPLVKLSELNSNDVVCTAYIAGSVGSFERSTKPLIKAFNCLQEIIKKPIKGILPVEIGPGDIAETVKIASVADLPVIDADFVGKRSSPEVYLETITLRNLPRTPMVISGSNGKTIKILKNKSPQQIEKIVRKFAQDSGGDAFVVGYPLTVKKIKGVVGENTLSLCQKIDNVLSENDNVKKIVALTNGSLLFEGSVTSKIAKDDKGFLTGYIKIKGQNNFKGKVGKIYFKNENLLFWVNDKLILTCPDLICVLDQKTKLGVYNRDIKLKQNVIILGIPSLPIWKTTKGQKLFSPRTFGYNFKPVLLPHTVAR